MTWRETYACPCDEDAGYSAEAKLTAKQKTQIDEALGPISAGLRAALRKKARRGQAYLQLFGYLIFMLIYMYCVYMQSDVLNAYTAGAYTSPCFSST